MNPIGWKSQYPDCPMGLRITDLWLNDTSILDPPVGSCGKRNNKNLIVFIALEKNGERKEFSSSRDAATYVGVATDSVTKRARDGRKIAGWKIVDVRRGCA